MKETAGQRIQRDLAAALAQAVKEQGPLEFDELDRLAIERAVANADRAEVLRALFDEELTGEKRSSVLTRLSAEARHLDRSALEIVRTITCGLLEPPKSDRHVRAVRTRWDQTRSRVAR